MSSTADTYETLNFQSESAGSDQAEEAADSLLARAQEIPSTAPSEEEDYEEYEYELPTDNLAGINRVRVAFIGVIGFNCFIFVLFVMAKTPAGQFLWKEDVDVAKSEKYQQPFTSTDVMDNFKLCTACEKLENKILYRYSLDQLRSDENPSVCCFYKMNQLLWFFDENVHEAIINKKAAGPTYQSLSAEFLQKPIAHLISYKTPLSSIDTKIVYMDKTEGIRNGIKLRNSSIVVDQTGTYFIYIHVMLSQPGDVIFLRQNGATILMQATVKQRERACTMQGVFSIKHGDQLQVHVITAKDGNHIRKSYFGIYQI